MEGCPITFHSWAGPGRVPREAGWAQGPAWSGAHWPLSLRLLRAWRVCEAWRGASLVPSAGPSPACGGAGGASNDPESPEGVPAPATAG